MGQYFVQRGVDFFAVFRGEFERAEAHFRAAVETQTGRNPNPYDSEPHYNLGLALKMQGRYDEAYAALYKATWSAAQQAASFFTLAQIASIRGDYDEAIDLAGRALVRNWHNHKARALKAAGLSYGEIERRYGVRKGTAHRWCSN